MAMSPVKKRKAPKGTRNGGLWFKFIYSGGGGGGSLSRCHQDRAWKMPGEEGESLVDICWKCIQGSQCKGPGAKVRVACLATRRGQYGWSRVSHGEGNRM